MSTNRLVVISEVLRDSLVDAVNDLACYEMHNSQETTPGVPILKGRLADLENLKAHLHTAENYR